MKVLPAVISFVLLLQFSTCFGAVANNFDELVEASNHGHETGLANKEKRCREPLQLNRPLYDHFLGSKVLPSSLKRRSPSHDGPSNNPMVQLASRFKSEEPATGLSETQERYYTVGSFGHGPKQEILSKLLNIPQDVQLERLVILAKNKSKAKAQPVPHPVVIDTAHVFTRNDGKPTEVDLELHGVKGDEGKNINNLTSQLNKELDAAIDTKKHMLGDSHLTPEEIDKIIEHVVEQLKKKTPVSKNSKSSKEIVGSTMDLTKPTDSDAEDKAPKHHGFIDEQDDVVGTDEGLNFKDDMSEVPSKDEDKTSLLGKKHKLFGHFKGHKGHKGHKGKGYFRQNEDLDNEDNEDAEDDNPLHADMSEFKRTDTFVGQAPDHHQRPQEIEDLIEMEGPPKDDVEPSVVGMKKTKSYGNGYGHGKNKGKGYYRENEEEDVKLGGQQSYYEQQPSTFQETAPGYQEAGQYAPSGNQQQYNPNQHGYEEYPEQVYEQVEPETYQGTGPSYPAPQSDNHYQVPTQQYQPQNTYQNQPQAVYQRPTYQQQQAYAQPQPQRPQQYAPQPAQYQEPVKPQAAYSSSKNYKSVDTPQMEEEFEDVVPEADILGTPQNIPEDPTLKATFFENEVKRLRQWISDHPTNAEQPSSATHRHNQESGEREELVDKFTKVIEKDLTDGKRLTPIEKKNLDKKIAKLVRDNLNDKDTKSAEAKSRKKFDKLEELVEEESDGNEEADDEVKVGSNLNDFKTRFSPKAEDDAKDGDEVAPKKKPVFGSLLRASKKPVPDLKQVVEDLKAFPNKLAGMMKPAGAQTRPTNPKLGMRSGLGDNDVEDGEKVGTFFKKEKYPDWEIDYNHGGYDDYRSADKKDTVLSNLDKLLHPKQYAHKKNNPLSENNERSGEEEDAVKSLPEIFKEIEENIEENLHLPPLGPLPAMRQSHPTHQHQHPIVAPQHFPKGVPKIQVNGQPFVPNGQNIRPPLPEMPPRGMPQPGFRSRNFQENAGPEHFDVPMPQNFQRFQGFQPQQDPQNFLGAPQPQFQQHRPMTPQHQGPQSHQSSQDMTHFGKIVPEHLHDLHLRDVTEQMKKHRMYFVGDGIKLPLHMHRHEDGTFHLSVDLQKLCGKCNTTDCKNAVKEPDFMSTNILGSTHDNDNGIDIEDVPLMMKTPNFEEEDDKIEKNIKNAKKKITKRSPRFNYVDGANTNSESSPKNVKDLEEKFDYLLPITKAIKDDVEHKIGAFNKDIKDYYQNEAEIKKIKMEHGGHGDFTGFLERRVGLLSNILGLLSDVTFEDF